MSKFKPGDKVVRIRDLVSGPYIVIKLLPDTLYDNPIDMGLWEIRSIYTSVIESKTGKVLELVEVYNSPLYQALK